MLVRSEELHAIQRSLEKIAEEPSVPSHDSGDGNSK